MSARAIQGPESLPTAGAGGARRSLAALHPGHRLIPVLLAVCAASLATAYALPVMVVSKFFFFSSDYTLLSSIAGMWGGGYYLLAAIILAFSVLFPLAKLAVLALVWYRPLTAAARGRVLHWLGVLGKWSMLDVFVVALIVVLTQSKALLGAEPREGLYVFAGAILLSMVTTVAVERLARRGVS